MFKTYWIYRVGDGPNPLQDAKDFHQTSTSQFGRVDALETYLKWLDEHSNFVDGYPSMVRYAVVDCETGEETEYSVETEFEPSFVIYK